MFSTLLVFSSVFLIGNAKFFYKPSKYYAHVPEISNFIDDDKDLTLTKSNLKLKQDKCATPFCQIFGFNLGEKVRFEWDRQRPKILAMAEHPKTKNLIQEMVEAHPCVSDLEGYDALMELGTRYVEANAEEIENFYMTTISFKGEKNMTALFAKYAVWYSQLDDIWNQVTFFRCQANPKVFVESIRELALVLYRMALVEDIEGLQNDFTRKNYLYSARALEALATSSNHFLSVMAKVDCYAMKDAMVDWTELSAVATDDFADFMGAIGLYENAKEIRVRAAFVHSLADTLSYWPTKAPPAESCQGGRLGRAAKYMQNISDTIKEKGLDYLSDKYGVNFRLDLLL